MKRRILFCNYEFPPLGGGGSTVSKCLAREMARRGHQVEVVTSGFHRLRSTVRKKNFYLRRLPVLRKQTGQSNPIEMMSFVAIAAPWLLFHRRPEAIISFHSIPSGLAAFTAASIRGIPHIVLFRGGDVPGWLPGELENMHRRTLWLNRRIVYGAASAYANSDGLRDLAQTAFPKKKVGVFPNGIDMEKFKPPPEKPTNNESAIHLLFVGRITTQKGVDVILRALAEMKTSRPWKLSVVGTGPYLDEFRALAKSLRIDNCIEFTGWLDRPDVRRLYDEADVFVFPSRYEGMPNVVLEATACGIPVIGTRIAGTEQIIRDGENGFLIDVDDQTTLADRIKQLIENDNLRIDMGKKARRVAEAEWSWEKRGEELETIIESAIEG